jgi:hypothetical protein
VIQTKHENLTISKHLISFSGLIEPFSIFRLFLPFVAPHIVSLGEADQYHITWEATVLHLFVEQEARHLVFSVFRS